MHKSNFEREISTCVLGVIIFFNNINYYYRLNIGAKNIYYKCKMLEKIKDLINQESVILQTSKKNLIHYI